jgi:hypothetical protein
MKKRIIVQFVFLFYFLVLSHLTFTQSSIPMEPVGSCFKLSGSNQEVAVWTQPNNPSVYTPFNQGNDYTWTLYLFHQWIDVAQAKNDIESGRWQGFRYCKICGINTYPADFCPAGNIKLPSTCINYLKAWFPFDELNTTNRVSNEMTQWQTDECPSFATATWYGNVTPAWGKVFFGMSFDGSNNSYLQMEDHSLVSLNPDVNFGTNTSMTFSLWFSLSDNQMPQVFFDKRTEKTSSYPVKYKGYSLLYWSPTKQFVLQLADGQNINGLTYTNHFSNAVSLITGKFYNLIVTVNYIRQHRKIYFYLDSTQIGYCNSSRYRSLVNTAPLTIGGHSFKTYSYKGVIDELQIFKKVLTQGERSKIYDDGQAGVFGFKKPVDYYNCIYN